MHQECCGMMIDILVPLPTSLCIIFLPPWAFTIISTKLKPKPMPGCIIDVYKRQPRNLINRIEVLTPVYDEDMQADLLRTISYGMRDKMCIRDRFTT